MLRVCSYRAGDAGMMRCGNGRQYVEQCPLWREALCVCTDREPHSQSYIDAEGEERCCDCDKWLEPFYYTIEDHGKEFDEQVNDQGRALPRGHTPTRRG